MDLRIGAHIVQRAGQDRDRDGAGLRAGLRRAAVVVPLARCDGTDDQPHDDEDAEDEPRGNVRHIADNGLSIDEVEDVLYDSTSRPIQSRSSRRPALIGRTSTGKTIIVIYERHKDAGHVVIRPVSAYEIED